MISRYESRQRLKRAIEVRLVALNPGEPLPPVRSLMREHNTSVTRLNRLFDELAGEGLIDRRPGAGIFKVEVAAKSPQLRRSGQMQRDANCLRLVVLLDSWPGGAHSFAADLFGLMRQRAMRSARQCRLVCEFADFATQGREELDRLVDREDVDAIVGMPCSREGIELMHSYRSDAKPVFCFFRHADNPYVPSIYVDHCRGAYQAVEYLCSIGHERIGFIGMPMSPGNPAQDRERGYREALQAHGQIVDPNLVLHVECNHKEICDATHHLLTLDDPVTALFTADGLLVHSTLHGLAEMGKNIPDDISLLCYDDLPECRTYRTPISVVQQPFEQVVEAMFQEITARVENLSNKRHDVAIPPELVLRASCQRRILPVVRTAGNSDGAKRTQDEAETIKTGNQDKEV